MSSGCVRGCVSVYPAPHHSPAYHAGGGGGRGRTLSADSHLGEVLIIFGADDLTTRHDGRTRVAVCAITSRAAG